MSGKKMSLKYAPECWKTHLRVSNFKFFLGSMPPDPTRGAATRRALYASTIPFSCLLSSDQTSITFSNDNPEKDN